ncbi:hypothetical protein B0I35DRAFT_482366 [Stachybotrys elegans]|uniref:Transcription activator GCR1-like domain-containing protein n=1 Tax=Stachybotrys elegans TaxID=80388 RepID=A0A8K0SJW1_9HYPO|nr:hypothetical protein B0I35DRAFT_482366 [Stachybotrys elegans]
MVACPSGPATPAQESAPREATTYRRAGDLLLATEQVRAVDGEVLHGKHEAIDKTPNVRNACLSLTTNMLRQILAEELDPRLTSELRELANIIDREVPVRTPATASPAQVRHLLPTSPRRPGLSGRSAPGSTPVTRPSPDVIRRAPRPSRRHDVYGRLAADRLGRPTTADARHRTGRSLGYEQEVESLGSEMGYGGDGRNLSFRATPVSFDTCDNGDGGASANLQQQRRFQPRRGGWRAVNDDQEQDWQGVDKQVRGLEHDPDGPVTQSTDAEVPCLAPSRPPTRHGAPVSTRRPALHMAKPRYSKPRQTELRIALGPPDNQFRYYRMSRTVAGVWAQYHHGTDGNHAIRQLEEKFGTGWRGGTTQEVKYGSNYVGVRKKIVRYVERTAEEEGAPVDEFIARLDAHIDGRIQELVRAITAQRDPFVEILPR